MKQAFFISFIFFGSSLFASPGCLDNSWHMARSFDTKSYHPVAYQVGTYQTYCQCPCRKLSLNRGQCFECGHRHDMAPMHIIRYKKNKEL